jgi:hypothetical protein
VLVLATHAGAQSQPKAGGRTEKPLPPWNKIEEITKKTLADRYGYQPGDIIGRSDVEATLTKLAALGWKPLEAPKLIKAAHADNDFIVARLREPEGWRFMRHVATYPEGYDRVDRLLRMPRGETMVADLITNPGGYQLFEYMTTAQGGIEMGRMLERIPSGQDFNDPTGRLYTEKQFLSRLHQSYVAEQKRRNIRGQ